jgi:hypothetical protein
MGFPLFLRCEVLNEQKIALGELRDLFKGQMEFREELKRRPHKLESLDEFYARVFKMRPP